MELPQRLIFKLYAMVRINLGDVIVRMTVRAGTKNPFLIEFPKTNKEGKTSITAIEFKEQVDFQSAMGVMDYNGSIETASQVVSIDLNLHRELLKDELFLEISRKGYLRWIRKT